VCLTQMVGPTPQSLTSKAGMAASEGGGIWNSGDGAYGQREGRRLALHLPVCFALEAANAQPRELPHAESLGGKDVP